MTERIESGIGVTLNADQKRINWLSLDEDRRTSLIRNMAEVFVAEHGGISDRKLKRARNYILRRAILKFYSGGISVLRADMLSRDGDSPPPVILRKPKGYWTPEVTRQESLDFYGEHGSISWSTLRQAGRRDLLKAIEKYPAELLLEELALPKEARDGRLKPSKEYKAKTVQTVHWTDERIEQAAMAFFRETGHFSISLLRKSGRSGLASAIIHHYPGQTPALKAKLGLELAGLKTTKEFWSEEQIEKQARDFVEKYGTISDSLLSENSRSDLRNAIRRHYKGSMRALKRKLDLKMSRQRAVTSDIANEQFALLLEESASAKDETIGLNMVK